VKKEKKENNKETEEEEVKKEKKKKKKKKEKEEEKRRRRRREEDETEGSETSVYKIQTPENYPDESIQHSEHSESLKSRIILRLLHPE
jgi:hypothetical protein